MLEIASNAFWNVNLCNYISIWAGFRDRRRVSGRNTWSSIVKIMIN